MTKSCVQLIFYREETKRPGEISRKCSLIFVEIITCIVNPIETQCRYVGWMEFFSLELSLNIVVH